MQIYCCSEHVELALDVIVDECEVAPIIYKVEDCPQKKCEYCEQEPIYLVDNK